LGCIGDPLADRETARQQGDGLRGTAVVAQQREAGLRGADPDLVAVGGDEAAGVVDADQVATATRRETAAVDVVGGRTAAGLPTTRSPFSVPVPVFATPPPVVAELSVRVLSVTVSVPPSFATAPPSGVAALLAKVLLPTISAAVLRTAPPSPPVAELLSNVLLATVSVPEFAMPPPVAVLPVRVELLTVSGRCPGRR
jgi:hypothetical protein